VKLCPTCGTEYGDEQKFCPKDGSALRGTQQGDLIAERERFLLLVSNEHGRNPDGFDGQPQLAARALAERRVEVRQRLIEQQQPGLGGEGPRQGDTLLLAAREGVDPPVLEAWEIDQREQAAHPLVPVARARNAEGNVLGDGEVREQRVVLEHHADATGRGKQVGDVLPLDLHRALVRPFEAREHAQGRGLPAPARAEERQHLAARQGKREIRDRGVPGESLGDAAQLEERPLHQWREPRPRT